MAATAPPLRSVERERPSTAPATQRAGLLAVSALTLLAVLVHGYHPYAEDGGLYLAGIKRVLHPDLYPYWSGFTTAHLRFSLFAPMIAVLVRISHLSLMTVMLLIYIASIWATLYAAWKIANRCWVCRQACYGAVALLALLLTVPVAGTSLMLMDPYVSARSISTPCGLFAMIAVVDMARQLHGRVAMRSVVVCFGTLFLALLVHPLMAAYALGCVLVLAASALIEKRQWAFFGGLGLAAVVAAVLILGFSPATPSGYMDVARTRAYWFPGTWQWYELAGLAAPLLVLGVIRYGRPLTWWNPVDRGSQAEPEPLTSRPFADKKVTGWGTGSRFDNARLLAQMGLIVGGLSILIALLFARVGLASYAVARLQPLRVFQTVYVVTIVMVGAALGRLILRQSWWRWTAMTALLGGLMVMVQLASFPGSNHLELPWVRPSNGWEQAFLWIRNNTSKSTVVALDADYITEHGEDAQNFRAIAERSAIPDYSKDGGIAAITPDLTAAWIEGEAAQKGLDRATDGQRLLAIRDISADWMVLSGDAVTALACDYANQAAKVCRVPSDVRARVITPRVSRTAMHLSGNVAHMTKPSTSRH